MALQPSEVMQLLELALAAKDCMELNLPTLVDDVNSLYPDALITVPASVDLGVQIEMIQRDLTDLPAIAIGVYNRHTIKEGEQAFGTVLYPFTIEVYCGDTNPTSLYKQSSKWAILLCALVQRYFSDLIPGYTAEQMPDVEVTYVLGPNNESVFHQLVVCTGTFLAEE